MKIIKSATLILLSALFMVNSTHAETPNKNEQQNIKRAEGNNKKNQQANKKPAEDKNLKQFNANVTIRLLSAQVISQNQKQALELIYSIENKNKKHHIKSVNWIGTFLHNNQLFFAQDIPITFDTPLKSKSKYDVTVTIPFETISKPATAIFLDPNKQITNLIGARNIIFTNGTKIEVK